MLVLPPAGAELFRPFTLQSLQKIQEHQEQEEKLRLKHKENNVEVRIYTFDAIKH